MSFDAGCRDFYGQKAEPLLGFGKYSEWDKFDIIERLKPMFARGWYIEPKTGKISIRSGLSWQAPWWYNKSKIGKNCTLWHRFMFDNWGFVPRGCQECWKIVIRPRTLKELFALRELERILDLPAKCGIEVRSYTPAFYGGYVYNNSLDEGRAMFKVVREAVNDMISPKVGVILKRGCTEMELNNGPSIFWGVSREQIELEDYLAERIACDPVLDGSHPDYMWNRVFKRWVLWAFCNSDETFREYTNGKDLYPPVVTYHEGDLDVVKRDVRVARMVTTGVADDSVEAIFEEFQALKDKHRLSVKQVGAAFGYAGANPLSENRIELPAQVVSQEVTGEEDQTT